MIKKLTHWKKIWHILVKTNTQTVFEQHFMWMFYFTWTNIKYTEYKKKYF